MHRNRAIRFDTTVHPKFGQIAWVILGTQIGWPTVSPLFAQNLGQEHRDLGCAGIGQSALTTVRPKSRLGETGHPEAGVKVTYKVLGKKHKIVAHAIPPNRANKLRQPMHLKTVMALS